MKRLLILCLALWFGTSALANTRDFPKFQDDWEKRRWILKLARTLRAGHGLTPAESLDVLEQKSSAELYDYFTSSPEFGDTVLDFNLYFMGYKPQMLRDVNGLFVDTVTRRASPFAFPGAVLSAQEVLKNGDYLKLLNFDHEVYTGPLREPLQVPEHPEYTADQLRQYWFDRAYKLLDRALGFAEQGFETHRKEYCDTLTNKDNFYVENLNAGVPDNLNYHLTFRQQSVYFHLSYGVCTYLSPWKPEYVDQLRMLRDDYPNLLKKFLTLLPKDYTDRTVSGMRSFDFGPWATDRGRFFSPFMFIELLNSSTNLERKRGAYVLKHYFCDDLTPVNVPIPNQHAGNQHSSDASCYSCHYKLDPMAGFFRTIGNVGTDYALSATVRFDDGVRVPVEEYVSNWKAAQGSARTWDVGYVRSSQFPEHNEYGESMQDLFRIIQGAPEVKKCIVKRMHQYFVGENQTVDPGYLEYLANGFIKAARTNSSLAFRDTLYKLVTNNAFVAGDPRRDECYDYEPGTNPAEKPPCKVSYLLQKNCASCHSGSGASGGLNLTAWIRLSEGGFGFPHTDTAGVQRPRAETIKRIEERMTTDDTDRRMPYNRYISSEDQVQIVSWVNGQMKRRGKRK